ncbi:hypothetical protein HanIR_Chr17g0897161 [Helianthus annuus]|nr:hypothetical protein HanIR_Chr17g0897161 [Helianthus annuus]
MPYGMSINTLRWHTRQFTTQHHKLLSPLPQKLSAEHPLIIHHIFRFCSSHSNIIQVSSVTHKKAWCTRSSKDLFL